MEALWRGRGGSSLEDRFFPSFNCQHCSFVTLPIFLEIWHDYWVADGSGGLQEGSCFLTHLCSQHPPPYSFDQPLGFPDPGLAISPLQCGMSHIPKLSAGNLTMGTVLTMGHLHGDSPSPCTISVVTILARHPCHGDCLHQHYLHGDSLHHTTLNSGGGYRKPDQGVNQLQPFSWCVCLPQG